MRLRWVGGAVAVLIAAGCAGVPVDSPPASPSVGPTTSATPSDPLTAPRSPTPSATLSAEPTASASPSPSPSPLAHQGLELEWRREPADFGDAQIRDSAVVGNRIAVIGTRYADDDTGYVAAIWWEDEDLVWRQASLPPVAASGNLFDVTSGGPGLVVVGRYDDWPAPPLVWTSTDAASWSAALVDVGDRAITLHRVARAADGLVAFGIEESGEWATPRSIALVSADGTTWTPATNQATHDLIPYGSEGIVVGAGTDLTALVGGAGRGPVSIWRAAGRDDWRRVGELPASARHWVRAAVVGPHGWVAIGAAQHGTAAWVSADGIDWQRADNAPQFAQDAFADRSGFIVVGWYDPVGGCAVSPDNYRNLTWTSSDGRIWRLVHDVGDGASMQSLRRRGRTLIGIGMIGDSEGALWTAQLPDASTDAGPVPSQPVLGEPDGCV